MDEEWRSIPEWAYYEASSLGRIRSLDRTRKSGRGNGTQVARGRILKARLDRHGYPMVSLAEEGQTETRYVHRLVAAAFLGRCPEGQEVRHLDGVHANAVLLNLAYGTRSENMLDIDDYGIHHNVAKTQCPEGHPYDETNTHVESGRRRCKTCRNAEQRARRARLKVTR